MKSRGYGKKIATGLFTVAVACSLSGCGNEDVSDFANYAASVDTIAIPEGTRVVALGEASHGNKEFQELKLQVFQNLVENSNVRALALEADFAGCAKANEYILHGEGTAKEATEALGFRIYCTDEMQALIEWMHEYNMTAGKENQVRFYGFDCQRDMYGIDIINEFYQAADVTKGVDYAKKLQELYGEEEDTYDLNSIPSMQTLAQEIVKDMEEHEEAYVRATSQEEYAYALHAADCLEKNAKLHAATTNYGQLRDEMMADNVHWILELEENTYQSQIMLAGHNGHVAKVKNSSYTNMGTYLKETLGDDYFVIGTDFYNTTCNIANENGRDNYQFCSDDPLAKEVGAMEGNEYYLDFSKAFESKSLDSVLSGNMKTGSLGEGYSPIMKFSKATYQIQISPKALYDGMIFVYEATPTNPWES